MKLTPKQFASVSMLAFIVVWAIAVPPTFAFAWVCAGLSTIAFWFMMLAIGEIVVAQQALQATHVKVKSRPVEEQ